MAGILNTVYAAAAAFVAIVGVAYVLTSTPDAARKENRWSDWSLTLAVAIFLAATLWTVL